MFSQQTRDHLKNYVYGLVDPRDQRIFYVGKASANNRAFDHLNSLPEETEKSRIIEEIRSANMKPEIDILRYGIRTQEECFNVEAAIIDAIGLEKLANRVRGHGVARGRASAIDLERRYGSKPVEVDAAAGPCILFFIDQTYSTTMSEIEVYDCTRQFWHKIGASTRTRLANGALPYRVGLAVADGVAVRAYSIAEWLPAGTTQSTRAFSGMPNRWEFVGRSMPAHPWLGHRLVRGSAPVRRNQQGYTYIR